MNDRIGCSRLWALFSVVLGGLVAVAAPSGSADHLSEPEISGEFPYAPHYVTVRGSKVHYVDEGEGDPILFVHGNATSSYVWRNVIPHAASVGRAIAPDLIGMGRSDLPDIEYRLVDHAKYLEALIKKLRLRKITLVVEGWGSALGFQYAMRNEKNVKAIAFMEAGLAPFESWDDFPRAERERFRSFRAPEVGRELIVDQNVLGQGPRVLRGLTPKEIGHYGAPFEDPARRRVLWRWVQEIPIAGEPADVHEMVQAQGDWLRRTDLPKLLFYSTPGLMIGKSQVEWCRRNLKNLQVVHAGPGFHHPAEENPQLIGEVLMSWQRSLARANRSRR